jgi:hypothetical protein
MVERVHRQLKDALRARGASPAWHSHLPCVLLGLRAAPKEDSAVYSAELATGTPLVLPGKLLHVPDPPRVDVPPPPYAVRCSGGQHTAGSLSQGGARVSAGWRPAEAAGGPICRPLPGGFQGCQDLYHPGGPAAGDRVSGPAQASHWPGSSLSC